MEDESITGRRWVGLEGQFTHALARRFAYNRMRLLDRSGRSQTNYLCLSVKPDFLDVLTGLVPSPAAPLARRILEGASAEVKEKLARLPTEPIRNLDFLYRAMFQREWAEWAEQLLNECLPRRDLYHSSLAEFLTEDSKEILNRGLEVVEDSEITRFNRMLLDAAFSEFLHQHPGPVFETFCDSWLRRMLGTSGGAEIFWTDPDNYPPNGYLERFVPDDERARTLGGEEELRDLNIYSGPLFGETGRSGLPAAPGDMSSGFHQVAAMVVQAGLMRANEVLCIENPEVHLHPKLQLGVAEFLIQQARIGKTMILETHSDLVVRRVIRAILEEDIKQEAVRIHFADVDLESPSHRALGYASSRIQVIEIDEKGKIQNWPAGFMDDDVRESRRLLDVMYGTPGEVGGDEEPMS
jgi:hypothetical protein